MEGQGVKRLTEWPWDLYFSAWGNEEGEGLCKRHAPSPTVTATSEDLWTAWPITDEIHWCGEHPDFPAYIESLREPMMLPSGGYGVRPLSS